MFYGKCVREPPLQSSEGKIQGCWARVHSDLSEIWHLATGDDGIVSKFLLHLQKKPMENCIYGGFDVPLSKFCGVKEVSLPEAGSGIARGAEALTSARCARTRAWQAIIREALGKGQCWDAE